MSDDGGDNTAMMMHTVAGLSLTFSDEAATFVPADSILSSGTFKPFDDDTDFDEFLPAHADDLLAPAPSPSAATTLSTFDGHAPNGTWSVYLVDDDPGPPTPAPQGFLDGWCINITTSGSSGAAVPADFNGNGTTDVSVFRPSSSSWYALGVLATSFGTTGDIHVPGDYNGNGTTDVAVFRPSTGLWFVNGGSTTGWGGAGDIPVPGDYNGNGAVEPAVYRPSNNTWYVNGGTIVAFGTAGDRPLPLPYAIQSVFFP